MLDFKTAIMMLMTLIKSVPLTVLIGMHLFSIFQREKDVSRLLNQQVHITFNYPSKEYIHNKSTLTKIFAAKTQHRNSHEIMYTCLKIKVQKSP